MEFTKTIKHSDCISFMEGLASNSIDLVYCDLPYGTTQCSWDIVIPFESMWKELRRICKDKTPIIFHGQQPFASLLITSNLEMFRFEIIWEKSKATGFLNAKKRPLVAHENILVFSKKSPNYYPQMTEGVAYDKGIRKEQTSDDVYGKFNKAHIKSNGLRYPRSVQYFKTAESEGKTFHKTQKPLALAKWIVNTFSKQGDTVLDFCFGSGTSAIASSDRFYFGCDSDEKIFKIAERRIDSDIHKKTMTDTIYTNPSK